MKQITIHVRITEEQDAALAELKRRLGTPYSESVRRALDLYFGQSKEGEKCQEETSTPKNG